MNHSEIVSFLWGVADLIRDTFRRGKYEDVILPLTVLRRLDCVLAPTKEKVLTKQAELRRRDVGSVEKPAMDSLLKTSRVSPTAGRADRRRSHRHARGNGSGAGSDAHASGFSEFW